MSDESRFALADLVCRISARVFFLLYFPHVFHTDCTRHTLPMLDDEKKKKTFPPICRSLLT